MNILFGVAVALKCLIRPLHTRDKSRAREIVRAQTKASQGGPGAPPQSCTVVTDSQV